jgi:hypothetical protein
LLRKAEVLVCDCVSAKQQCGSRCYVRMDLRMNGQRLRK